MTIATVTRKTLLAALFVPAIAMTGITAEAFSGASEASAQQQISITAQRPDPRGKNPGGGDDPINQTHLRPCPPGTPAAVVDCQHWNPPREASSADECECEIKYQFINGQRVAVKDCYVLLPSNQVLYCENEKLVRR